MTSGDKGAKAYNPAMPGCRILILTALLPEGRALARSLQLKKVEAPLPLWQKDDVAVVVVGMRGVRLPEVVKMPEIAHPEAMVMAGLAGGLASELARGALVLDGKGMPGSVINGVRVGLIHTSNSIVATPAEKARLLADTGCIAVDMETAIARRFASKQGAAFASLRAISDTVRDTLDPTLLTLIDNDGRVKTGAVMKLLVRRPGQLKTLLALRRTSALGLANLSEVLKRLVVSKWPASSTKRQAPP